MERRLQPFDGFRTCSRRRMNITSLSNTTNSKRQSISGRTLPRRGSDPIRGPMIAEKLFPKHVNFPFLQKWDHSDPSWLKWKFLKWCAFIFRNFQDYNLTVSWGSRHIGPVKLPAAHVGQDHADAGDLTKLIMKIPFKKAKFLVECEGFKNSAIEFIHALLGKSEPFPCLTNPWAVGHLLQNTQEKLDRVESANLRSEGDEPPRACKVFKQARGPWAKCIIVEGVDGITACDVVLNNEVNFILSHGLKSKATTNCLRGRSKYIQSLLTNISILMELGPPGAFSYVPFVSRHLQYSGTTYPGPIYWYHQKRRTDFYNLRFNTMTLREWEDFDSFSSTPIPHLIDYARVAWTFC